MDKVTIAYDENTGNIVAIHGGREEEFIQLLAEDGDFLRDNSLDDIKGIRTIFTDVETKSFVFSEYYITENKLTPLHHIVLSTDAQDKENPNGVPEIAGDGKSSCEISAKIVDVEGNLDKEFSGEVMFQTARGKLSARNGIVQAKKGVAKVILTSVPETVPPFEIRSEAEGCTPDSLQLEFFLAVISI